MFIQVLKMYQQMCWIKKVDTEKLELNAQSSHNLTTYQIHICLDEEDKVVMKIFMVGIFHLTLSSSFFFMEQEFTPFVSWSKF